MANIARAPPQPTRHTPRTRAPQNSEGRHRRTQKRGEESFRKNRLKDAPRHTQNCRVLLSRGKQPPLRFYPARYVFAVSPTRPLSASTPFLAKPLGSSIPTAACAQRRRPMRACSWSRFCAMPSSCVCCSASSCIVSTRCTRDMDSSCASGSATSTRSRRRTRPGRSATCAPSGRPCGERVGERAESTTPTGAFGVPLPCAAALRSSRSSGHMKFSMPAASWVAR